MDSIQAHYRMPTYESGPAAELIEMMTERVTHAFYDDLDRRLKDAPGGLLVGQPRVTVKTEDDWLFKTGSIATISMTANVEDLPIPPEYRLFGGPADGSIVRTHGERIWLVPVAPPPPTVMSYAEPTAPMRMLVAEYERRGKTSAYFYKRMRDE